MEPRSACSIVLLLLGLVAGQVTSEPTEVKMCAQKKNATKPEQKTPEPFAMGDTTGNERLNCVIAQVAAYVQLDQGQYLPLSEPKPKDVSCLDTRTKFTINYDCSRLQFTVDRKDSNATMKITLDADVWYPELNEHPIKGFDLFTTAHANHSYQCQSEHRIPIIKGNSSYYLVLSQVRIEAFRNNTGKDFYQPADLCEADQTSYLWIYIAVVLIAIVAFFAIDILLCDCCCCKVLMAISVIRSCCKCLTPC